MLEFSVSAFSSRLFDYLLESQNFPYMKDNEEDRKKHQKRNPLHLKQAIRDTTIRIDSDTKSTFDIGSETLELTHPYYHILQNSEVIHIRNKGTKKSKGSQDLIEDKAKRDYERVSWNGKTFTKEYSKNVRGARSRVEKARDKRYTGAFYKDGKLMFTSKNAFSNYYYNTHYKYIDKILDTEVVDRLAAEFGLKKSRKVDSGLGEEWETQRLIDMFGSHDII